ncbi:tRNA-splicing endonuclease [uncultured archaeon]|nr:tRNA-splicing endonuclease [uncultured archaeon]
MGITLYLDRKSSAIAVREPQDVSSLQNGFYGEMEKGVIFLQPEEALYMMDIRNARCVDEANNPYSFNDLASLFLKRKKLLARYLTFKDWRDRGLMARDSTEAKGDYGRTSVKKYAGGKFKIDAYSLQGVFFLDDLITIIDDEASGKELYEKYWLGQFGTYKAAHRGKIAKLDVYETIYLLKHGNLVLKNAKLEDVMKEADDRIKYFEDMYAVYEDWRNKGYVLKTGFKFGTHFRIYFPGASPVKENDEWIHSKHVVHIFPRRSKMLISEWSRAIRVAHSVKKTFILAIPGKKLDIKINQKKPRLDFLLYHRKKGGIETPKEGQPRYFMYSLSEDEYLGGEELAEALFEAKHYGLEVLLAIADRESSVTYYAVKRLELPGSDYEHFEIEWLQP